MSSSQTDPNPTTRKETSIHENVGPVPEQDPLIHSQHDANRDVPSQDVRTQDTIESKGLISTVVDAAKSAAYRAKEVLVGDDIDRTAESDKQRVASDDRATSYTDRDREDISGRATTEKVKDAAYDTKEKVKDTARDVKEKVKDTAYDTKEKVKDTTRDIRSSSNDTGYDVKDKAKDTAHDIKNKTKDAAYDIKDKTKDTAHDIKNKSKDVAYDIQDRTADTGHDYSSDRTRDTTLASDTQAAADSSTQKLIDIKDKVIDSAQAMWTAGKEKVKETLTPTDATTKSTTAKSTEPGVADMFSQDYQPGPAQYRTEPSKTDQAKSKLASTAANTADKAENAIAEGKQKFNEQADKAQYSAEEARIRADKKAQDLANDTRYYSGSDQLY